MAPSAPACAGNEHPTSFCRTRHLRPACRVPVRPSVPPSSSFGECHTDWRRFGPLLRGVSQGHGVRCRSLSCAVPPASCSLSLSLSPFPTSLLSLSLSPALALSARAQDDVHAAVCVHHARDLADPERPCRVFERLEGSGMTYFTYDKLRRKIRKGRVNE